MDLAVGLGWGWRGSGGSVTVGIAADGVTDGPGASVAVAAGRVAEGVGIPVAAGAGRVAVAAGALVGAGAGAQPARVAPRSAQVRMMACPARRREPNGWFILTPGFLA